MPHTYATLRADFDSLGIDPRGTVLIHSSMKAIGSVDGGADTVLDVWMDAMRDGLLVLPTHTWRQIGVLDGQKDTFDPASEPPCVGILPTLFWKRPGVIRSLHPTHSVAAYGAEAEEFTRGEEHTRTPLPRDGCWGRLYDRDAAILFVGASLKTNTLLHGAEEWAGVPNRLGDKPAALKIKMPDGATADCPQYRHYVPPQFRDVSDRYDKMEQPFQATGVAREGRFGDARCVWYNAKAGIDLTMEFLRRDPDLFLKDEPVPEAWYS